MKKNTLNVLLFVVGVVLLLIQEVQNPVRQQQVKTFLQQTKEVVAAILELSIDFLEPIVLSGISLFLHLCHLTGRMTVHFIHCYLHWHKNDRERQVNLCLKWLAVQYTWFVEIPSVVEVWGFEPEEVYLLPSAQPQINTRFLREQCASNNIKWRNAKGKGKHLSVSEMKDLLRQKGFSFGSV